MAPLPHHLMDISPATAAEQILETMSDALLLADTEGRIVDINRSGQVLCGYPLEALRGRCLNALIRNTDHQPFDPLDTSLVDASPQTGVQEGWLQHRGGEMVAISFSMTIMSGADYPVSGIVCVIHDISERKRAEALLRQANETLEARVIERTIDLEAANRQLNGEIEARKATALALAASEEKYRDLVENIDEVIFATNEAGEISYISPVFQRVSGYAPEVVMGCRFLDLIHRDDVDMLARWYGKLGQGSLKPAEFRLKHADGDFRWVRCSSRPIFMGERLVGGTGAFFDLSEQKELEAQLHQSQRMEAIGTLVGGIAHDFNNIIGIILGNAELAMEDIHDGHPAKVFLREIQTSSHRAREITRQLLNFSRNAPEERQPLDLVPVVKEALSMMRASIPKTVAFTTRIPDQCALILGDATQIHQVMTNLVSNAAHAMRACGGKLSVELMQRVCTEHEIECLPGAKPGPCVQLTIADNGHGIPAEVRPQIFDPYFTTKPVGEGTGLGLSVVHGIVERHDGTIRVDSEVGQGTTIKIHLPVITEAVRETAAEQLPVAGGDERILLLDDEAALVDALTRQLGRLGYQVEGFTEPNTALHRFQDQPHAFDLVLTDVSMPEIPGDFFVERLREIRPDIAVVLSTGYSERITPERLLQLKVAPPLRKPVDRTTLAKAVRDALNNGRPSP